MGGLFGGGGGGSPPTAPALKQVDTSLEGPLYTRSARMGDKWAQLMRANYGLGPASAGAPASWQAKYLGPGALAMMKQAGLPFAGQQDPQVQGALTKGFGEGRNLGADPYQMSRELGQQFKSPLGQLQRNQQFESSLLQQWKPPDLRLTGEDLLNVKMQQMTQSARARQEAYASALQGSGAAAQSQAAAQAAGIAAVGKIGTGLISAGSSSSLSPEGYYQPSFFQTMFSGGTPGYGTGTGYGNAFGADYSSPPSDVAPGGGGGSTSSFGS